jgi:hypothetical protein
MTPGPFSFLVLNDFQRMGGAGVDADSATIASVPADVDDGLVLRECVVIDKKKHKFSGVRCFETLVRLDNVLFPTPGQFFVFGV